MKDAGVILCVDDERIVLSSLQQQITPFCTDYNLEFAESVEEAWEIIDEIIGDGQKLALVISDWMMPLRKGDEFLVDLHKKHPETIQILLTGQADEEAIENVTKNSNLHCCVFKPWDQIELVANIAEALKQYK